MLPRALHPHSRTSPRAKKVDAADVQALALIWQYLRKVNVFLRVPRSFPCIFTIFLTNNGRKNMIVGWRFGILENPAGEKYASESCWYKTAL